MKAFTPDEAVLAKPPTPGGTGRLPARRLFLVKRQRHARGIPVVSDPHEALLGVGRQFESGAKSTGGEKNKDSKREPSHGREDKLSFSKDEIPFSLSLSFSSSNSEPIRRKPREIRAGDKDKRGSAEIKK